MSAGGGDKSWTYHSTDVLGRWLRVLLILSVLRCVTLEILNGETAVDAFRILRHRPVSRIYALPGPVSALQGLLTFAAAATIIVWLVWQHRSHINLFAAGLPDLRFTPTWAVGWWFVPIAAFVMPYRVMRELWQRSGAEADGRGGGWVLVWWLLFASSLTLTVVGALSEFHAQFAVPLELTARFHWFAVARTAGAIAAFLQAFAGILAFRIVSRIDRAEQEMRDATLSAWVTPAMQPRPDHGVPPG